MNTDALTPMLPSDADRHRGSAYWLTLAALMILAAVPRLYHLGTPGLAGNEDYAVLSARAILDHGVPRFPSGVIYPRALLVSYLTAGSTWLLGANEVAARIPWALLSALGVGVAYVYARRVFGANVALLAGFVLAFSEWEITTARTARMYGPLSIAFLVALYTMHKVVFDDDGRFRVPNLIATAAACSLHQLGAMLMVPYAAAFLLGKSSHRRGFIVLAATAVIVASGVDILFEQDHYSGFMQRAKTHVAGSTTVHDASDADDDGSSSATKLNAVSPFGRANLRNRQIVAFVVFAVGVAAAIALRNPRFAFAAAMATTVVLAGMQQLALAFYAAVTYLAWHAFARKRWSWVEASLLGGVLAIGAACWLGFLVAGPPALSPVKALRTIAGFPPNFLEIFARKSPLMFGVSLVGILVALAGYFYDRRSYAPHVLVVSALALSATALGFHPSAPRYFNERYVFQLHPFFVLLFAAGAWWLAARATTFLARGASSARRTQIAMLLGFGILLVSGAISPLATRAAMDQHYGKNKRLREAGGGVVFNPDHAGPSAFVCAEAGPGDAIVPMDILIHYVYCPRAEIQLTMSHKGDAEGWIGVRSVDSLPAVAAELERSHAPRVWIVLSGDAILQYRDKDGPRLAAATSFTSWDCAKRVYEGRDGISDAWVMDRECFLRNASQ